jgi:hypothetical protein
MNVTTKLHIFARVRMCHCWVPLHNSPLCDPYSSTETNLLSSCLWIPRGLVKLKENVKITHLSPVFLFCTTPSLFTLGLILPRSQTIRALPFLSSQGYPIVSLESRIRGCKKRGDSRGNTKKLPLSSSKTYPEDSCKKILPYNRPRSPRGGVEV